MAVSPTLLPGGGYLSIIARVPPPLAERIVRWRREYGMVGAVAESCHITLLIAQDAAEEGKLGQLKADLAGHGAVEVVLGEPESFQPASPVTYLPLARGADCFRYLHRRCVELLGKSESPFPYEPHLTLAHGLEEAALARSLRDFAGLDAQLTGFRIEQLQAYRYTGETWQHLADISLL